MKTIVKLLLWVLILGQTSTLQAQYIWKHIERMPCEETYSVTEDADGFLWFGTRLGLIRYDGYRLRTLRNDMQHPHAFSSCDIRSLCSDNVGRVYAGTFFGLNTLDIHSAQTSAMHFKPNDFVGALLVDAHGNVWIGTDYGLYVRTKDGVRRVVGGLRSVAVNGLLSIGKDKVMAISVEDGIFIIDSSILRVRPLHGTQEIGPRSAAVDKDGGVWIGTEKRGLFRWNGTRLTALGELTDCNINHIIYSKQRAALIVGTNKGLYIRTENGRMSGELTSLPVNRVHEDRSGNLWVSTVGRGIWFGRLQPELFEVAASEFCQRTTPIMAQFAMVHLSDTTALLSHTDINSVYADRQHRTYVGTLYDGIYIYQNGRILRHLSKHQTPWLRTNSCYAFIAVDADHIIMATWNGLYVFSPKTFDGKYISHVGKSDIADMHTLSGCYTRRGELWLGLVGGIARITLRGNDWRGASIHIYTLVGKKGIPSPTNVGQLTDARSQDDRYQLGGIFRIVEDKDGQIWACTSEPGLLRYDRKNDCFVCVSEKLGIKGDNVHSLDIDKWGNLWLTTNYGILQLRTDKHLNIYRRHLYTAEDGLPGNYFGSTMSTLLADGSIGFVNQEHLITIRPQNRDMQPAPSRVRITDFHVDGQKDNDLSSPILTQTDTDAETLTLTHRQNNLSVSFTALRYGYENTLCFAYKLEGIDEQYRLTENGQNTIYYSQLPPGSYTLLYGVASPSLKEPEKVERVRFTVLEPLWWRWWARMIYALLAIIVTWIVVYYLRERSRKRHQLEILEIEKRNIDEQYQKMTQFYTQVIHDFMTPVTLMSELTHQLQERVRPALQATAFMLVTQADKLREAMYNLREVKDDASVREAMTRAKEMTQTDQDFLRRCTESVNRHVADENYTHQLMMNEVGASHATLYRKLKALTGQDATTFIRSIRMKAACQILSEEPTIRIAELAGRVGYSNPKYFSTCFKKDFGISPRDYLEQCNRREMMP